MAADGYAWWYLDAVSDDQRHALTLIGFIGSVFSPYYALARRHGPCNPENHCSINVALYGAKRRWAMTERCSRRLYRDANVLEVGPSRIEYNGQDIEITLDEVTFPLPSRIRGRIRLIPEAQNLQRFALSPHQAHSWWPLMPRARIEVDLPRPGVRWSGAGYLDCNRGDGPLEQAFEGWSWSRSEMSDGSSRIFYDVTGRTADNVNLALGISPEGELANIETPSLLALPSTGWGIERLLRSGHPDGQQRLTTLENGPFYARTLVQSAGGAAQSTTMHESLSLKRFAAPWVQAMLPFRMPRKRA